MSDLVFSTQLDNGLTVHLKEMHTAPLVSHWVWYRVGSRNEVSGQTGISHWVEHMQFKGTPQFPPAVLDKAISREGGMWNAFTYFDWTTFFETMPADKIDLALRLESDRMVSSIYDPGEVELERTVILSEREGSENEPLFRLGEAVLLAAFNAHPYRYEVLGKIEDLKKISRDQLYTHYRTYYTPGNAILAMAGDFNTDMMIKRIEEYYGSVPTGKPITSLVTQEPPLTEERQVEVSGPDDTAFLQTAYRAPAGSSRDFFTFSILDSLLTGPSGLNMFGGGGISNRTSRLYKALVESQLAVGVGGGVQASIDPHLYEITATIHPAHTPEESLKVIDTEIQRLQSDLVSSDEIARAVKQARAQFAFGSENITNQGFWLGYAEMFANYDWFCTYMDKLKEVTPQDVQRVAQEYLQPQRRVIGIYRPERGKHAK